MLFSAEEFKKLRLSENQDEYRRATLEAAPIEVWFDVIEKYPELKFWVIHNKTVPLEILRVLSLDPDDGVRSAVARKRKLDEKLFLQLAKDPSERVRQSLASNKKIPKVILADLLDSLA